MSRFRITIRGLMLAVVLVAGDIDIVLKLSEMPNVDCGMSGSGRDLLPLEIYTLGVLPLATLLLVSAWEMARKVRKRGTLPAFGFGFQVAGWVSVLLFVGWSILWPRGVFLFLTFFLDPVEQFQQKFLAAQGSISVVVFLIIEWLLATVILASPGLLLATLCGWLVRRGGVSIVLTPPRIAYENTPSLEPIAPEAHQTRAAAS